MDRKNEIWPLSHIYDDLKTKRNILPPSEPRHVLCIKIGLRQPAPTPVKLTRNVVLKIDSTSKFPFNSICIHVAIHPSKAERSLPEQLQVTVARDPQKC
jgi:hypothetical protein